jgi:hypothetical protein
LNWPRINTDEHGSDQSRLALDFALAGASRSGWRGLFHCRSDVTAHERPLEVGQGCEADMAYGLALTFEYAIRIGAAAA